MKRRWILALLAACALVAGCRRVDGGTFYELTVNERDCPELRAITKGWWMYANNLQHFEGKTGENPLKITSALKGDVNWVDPAHSDRVKIRIEWNGDFDSRLECLGMSERAEHGSSEKPKLVIPLLRGKKTAEFECHVLQIYPTEPGNKG